MKGRADERVNSWEGGWMDGWDRWIDETADG